MSAEPRLAHLRAGVRPYLPDLLRAWVPTHDDDRHMQVHGTLAFVDISGFTRLTERLARTGNAGAEEMSDLLDATFSALLADARVQGADLVKWGGDAVLLLFSGADHAARACRAAFDMRATLRTVGTIATTTGKVALRMSVGMHSGPFDFYLVGDHDHHRELLVVGPAASHTARIEAIADAGQVALSDSTAALLDRRVHRPGPRPGIRLLRARPTEASGGVGTAPPEPVQEPALEVFLPRSLRTHLLTEQGEAEHRSVAVAFVRFSGTDTLSRQRGTSTVAEALDACVRNIQHATAEHDVTFFETDISSDGGKVMLVAGAPTSSGHDEERLLRAVRTVMDRAGVLPLRIGVNRGHVFAGDFGPPFRRTYSVKGDAVNLAARVMGKAADGEVLVTATTVERSQTRFATEELEPFFVKGKRQPVSASRLGAVLGPEQGRRPAGPFVGREPELEVMRAALADAADGRGRVVEVVGEAGIGKSRLITQLLSSSPSVTVLRAFCREYEATTPYFPFRSLLRNVMDLRGDADAAVTSRRLQEVVAGSAPELLPWLPLLAVPLDVEVDMTRESEDLDPRYRKARLEEVVEQLLLRLTSDVVVLVLDDVHFLDGASRDLLSRLARNAPTASRLIVLSRRETDGGSLPEPGPDLLTVRLRPLAPSESLRLTRATETRPMTRQEATALTARSGGNPLFLEELVATAGHLGSADLPESVHEMFTSRIDRLAPLDRLVLRYAAVLGTTVDLDVLEPLLAAHRSGVRLGEHLPALGDFLTAQDDRHVRFRHTLMRDVAYEGLPYRRRRLLHQQVGETLERQAAADRDQVSELLSLHYFHAGRFDRAWLFSRAAGDRAREKYANGEAIELLERAVEAARRSAGEVDAGEVAGVLEALGDVRHLAGRSSAAIEAYRSARRRRGADPVGVARLLSKQARTQQRLGKVPQSLRLVRRSFTSLDGVEGPEAAATRSDLATRYALGRWSQGRYADALRWATLAAQEAEGSGDKRTLALAYNSLHTAHYYAGVAEDVPYARLALLAYEELGDLAGQAHCVNNLGVEALDAGRLAEAAGLFARARGIFGRLGDEANEANATYNVADAMLRLGRYAEAEPLLHDALGIARAVGDEELVALVLRETGQLCVRLGRMQEALSHLADARERLTELGLTQELAALGDVERDAMASPVDPDRSG